MIGKIAACSVVFLLLILNDAGAEEDKKKIDTSILALGVIDRSLLPIGYSGREKLQYDVSWSGGIKLGELYLEINLLNATKEEYEIRSLVTTKNGAIHYLYPTEDVHVTKVRGEDRLPFHLEIWQKEGYNYRAHKVVEYDQDKLEVKEIRNNNVDRAHVIKGKTNNEFSAFFNSRLMPFSVGEQFIVPTFADHKRAEVVVNTVARKELKDTILGTVQTIEIMPLLTFEGLYEKKGDTVIWYTDDECRVPVKITSKIALGSLTARLTAYENPACSRYPTIKKN